jgi:ABC-type spermidine/putrescine transport system permease subunit I
MWFKKRKPVREKTRSEILIYIIMFLWVVFGILGIVFNTNMVALGGYYASLTFFVATYLWGEYKRSSTESTIFKKGVNSTRETIIYITLILWLILGAYGIIKGADMTQLTVYFAALAPFVSSYIIYKTSKGTADLPIFNSSFKSTTTTTETKSSTTPPDDAIPPKVDEDVG